MRIRGDRFYHLSITSVFVVTGFSLGAIGFPSEALAQNSIIPDNTLGNENSQINRETIRGIESDRISGGARRGQNLFHSFERFNIGEGLGAYFDNPEAVRNIFSRVTGNDPSDILGRLGVIQAGSSDVLGNANLFFINPNGILFGPNASLDLGGSFAATTANGMQFGEQGFFSATNPETPSQLLTIDPSAFFFNQIPAQSITQIGPPNQPNSAGYIEGLRVPDGRSLLLLGGQINIQDGRLRASGGRLELGGVAGAGTVGLGINGNQLSLNFPEELDRADVFITGLADIDVTGGGGGDIAMYARNLNILNGSDVCAGIGPTASCGSQTSNFGTIGSQAGDIVLDAQETIRIADAISEVKNDVNPDATGNSGNIYIRAESLLLNSGGEISASTFSNGNSGRIVINALNIVSIRGNETRSYIYSNPRGRAIGRSGGIEINTRSLLVENSQVSVSTFGFGKAGDLIVRASDSIVLRGERPPEQGEEVGRPGGLFAQVDVNFDQENPGDFEAEAGNILLETDRLSISDGSRVSVSTLGIGDGGNIIVRASEIDIFNTPDSGNFHNPGLFATSAIAEQLQTGQVPQGDGGSITIETDRLSISDRGSSEAGIFTTAEGIGNAGDISIDAQNIQLTDNGLITANVASTATGQGGDIEIRTNSLLLSNDSRINAFTSGRGEGGSIEIRATSLLLERRSQIIADTDGRGDAGSIRIDASDIQLNATSNILAGVSSSGIGQGGDIEIQADSILLTGGSQIGATVIRASEDEQGNRVPGGQGRGGNIRIVASDSIMLSGTNPQGFSSGIVAFTERDASGRAGDIFVETDLLRITNGAVVGVSTANRGNAGGITINARNLELLNGGQIVSATRNSGQAGEIQLNVADNIVLSGVDPNYEERLERARAFVEISGQPEDTSNITEVESISDVVITEGSSSGIFASTNENSSGDGGTIRLQADSISLTDGAQISAATSGSGNPGNIIIRGADAITLDNSSIATTINPGAILSNPSANQGNIEIQTRSLSITNNSEITASTEGRGRAGNIVVDAETVNLFDRGQLITSTSTNQRAGDITLRADRLNIDRGRISAESTGTGRAGDITLNLADRLQVSNGQILTSAEQASGGAITINAENADVRLSGTSDISTSVGSGAGSGGNIAVTAETIELRDDSDIRTSVAGGQGDGGNITLRASSILAFDDSDIIAATPAGQGGDITFATAAFFAENFDPDAANANPNELESDDRADVNASGAQPGTITTPDTSLIQNSLAELPESAIDSDTLLANSCVVRSQDQSGTFIIAGAEGLPQRPGDSPLPTYPTNSVRSTEESSGEPTWQMGDPIVEPQGMYRLADGRMVLSRECR